MLGFAGVRVFSCCVQEVQCPSCGESFALAVPPLTECPAQLDYDCEVCCRPMVIVVDEEGRAEAVGVDESLSG
jgi:hypothetical protein